VRVEIRPADGPADEAPAIRVLGAPAGAAVALTAAATDAAGHPWASRCVFRADAGGVVDPARDAPLAGSYAGVDPAGPIWSMAALGTPGAPRWFATPADRLALAVTARLADGTEARAVAIRRWRAPGVARAAAPAAGAGGWLFAPPPPGPHPAVVIVHGAGSGAGGPAAALLASRGYVALALAPWLGPRGAAAPAGASLAPHEVSAAASAAGVRALAARPGVDPRRLAAVGAAAGAEGLLVALASAPDLALRAVVTVAPSSAVWQTLRAERIAAPILFLAGGDDTGRPAPATAEAVWYRRRGSGYEQEDRYLTFAGAGQLLRPPLTPTTGAGPGGPGTDATPEGRARAEAGAWRAILEFLREHLR
jgi:dienelactone hydrolase